MAYPPQFSENYLYANELHLDKLNVFIERSGNNPMFLEINELPSILTYGKHYGLLSIKNPKGQPYYLKSQSKLQFEVKDSQGTVIFSSLANSNELLKLRTYDGAIPFYIWIKQDPLRTFKSIESGI